MAESDSRENALQHPGVEEPCLDWRLLTFDDMTGRELYAVLAARVAVFVVEQTCPYQELDGRDEQALHLAAWAPGGELAAYARILPPDTRFAEPSIGRVLTASSHRGCGLGRSLMRRAISETRARFPGRAVRISAQRHLEGFYGELGFRIDSEPYDEDGIPHVDMQLAAGDGDRHPGND